MADAVDKLEGADIACIACQAPARAPRVQFDMAREALCLPPGWWMVDDTMGAYEGSTASVACSLECAAEWHARLPKV
jgi:hypothetical protein